LRGGAGLVSGPGNEEPWRLVFTKQSQKDARKLAESKLRPAAEELLALLARNPWEIPPPYEKLIGDLSEACSRRINIQHRLVYQVLEKERVVKVIRMWTHYE
jgi:Txe/YoeB family toxin of toxin-antitoxin system